MNLQIKVLNQEEYYNNIVTVFNIFKPENIKPAVVEYTNELGWSILILTEDNYFIEVTRAPLMDKDLEPLSSYFIVNTPDEGTTEITLIELVESAIVAKKLIAYAVKYIL